LNRYAQSIARGNGSLHRLDFATLGDTIVAQEFYELRTLPKVKSVVLRELLKILPVVIKMKHIEDGVLFLRGLYRFLRHLDTPFLMFCDLFYLKNITFRKEAVIVQGVPRNLNNTICIQDIEDVCDRLNGSAQCAAAVLNGDIQEAISWILKYPDALYEIARLKNEIRDLQEQVKSLQANP
jgi:hypothetical protein